MRTSFIVGILGFAIAIAAATEWASRRTPDMAIDTARGTPPSLSTKPGVDRGPAVPESVGVPGSPGEGGTSTADADTTVLVIGGEAAGFRANALSLTEPMIEAIDQIFGGPDAPELLCGQFVIEGHTDNLGAKEVNVKVGLSRALAVRRYLSERYAIPRDAMRVVSYGPDRPVADNATQEGRALNRRVVIRMVAHRDH
jgi:outer membrane protein OmpA-like peptidoglycan-associated protein